MTGGSDERGNESLNELFDVLSHEYRRSILRSLASPERTDHGVGTILHSVEDGEPDILELELRHNHLPKLDDCGLVDWDAEAKRLARGPRFEEIEPFLEVVDENRDDIR
jgi:hypothetical protein